MQLDKTIQQHIAKMPANLQAEVYDFVLFLEYKQKSENKQKIKIVANDEVIKLTVQQQKNFAESLLNPEPPNNKLKKLAETYLSKTN